MMVEWLKQLSKTHRKLWAALIAGIGVYWQVSDAGLTGDEKWLLFNTAVGIVAVWLFPNKTGESTEKPPENAGGKTIHQW